MNDLKWVIETASDNGYNEKNTSGKTLQSKTVSPLAIFTREVSQNSRDNRLSKDRAAKVCFEIKYLFGKDKESFLENIKYFGKGSLGEHVEKTRNFQMDEKNRTSKLTEEKILKKSDEPLKLLYITEFGTSGLIGAETSAERYVEQLKGPHCFIGLCRNVGDTQKSDPGSGGTNGLGKAVLWESSRIKTVLFYSHLSEKYKTHKYRFFGKSTLDGRFDYDSKRNVSGEAYFGRQDPENNLVTSIYDDEANEIALKLGFKKRLDGEYGTSILVVDYDDPDTDDDIETEEETAENICKHAEDYFWPAILNEELIIQSEVRDRVFVADPRGKPHLKPFIECWDNLRTSKSNKKIIDKKISITIPQGPDEKDDRVTADINISINKEESEVGSTESIYSNKIALIRGAGMVIGYQNLAKRGFSSEKFHAAVIGGNASIKQCYENERCDHLLALSEPPSHDDWDPNSDNLKNNFEWKGAKAAVRKLKQQISTTIKNEISQKDKVEGKASISLAKKLKLLPGPNPTSNRVCEIRGVCDNIFSEDNGSVIREVSGKVKIPEIEKIKNTSKEMFPNHIEVQCDYSIIGEEKAEKVKVKSTRILLNGEELDKSDQFEEMIKIIVPLKKEKQMLNLTFITEKLEGISEIYTKKKPEINTFTVFQKKD